MNGKEWYVPLLHKEVKSSCEYRLIKIIKEVV